MYPSGGLTPIISPDPPARFGLLNRALQFLRGHAVAAVCAGVLLVFAGSAAIMALHSPKPLATGQSSGTAGVSQVSPTKQSSNNASKSSGTTAHTTTKSSSSKTGTTSTVATSTSSSGSSSSTSGSSSGSGSTGGTGTTSKGCPSSTPNQPDGPDPWGGCFPGPNNTGYPHGLAGDTRTPVTLTTYTGSCTVGAGTTVVIDSKSVDCSSQGLFVYGKLTVKNSKVKGEIYENSNSAVLVVTDTEVDGLSQYTFPAIGGGDNVTAIRVNVHNGEHTIQCYSNCDVEDSWMHDQFEAGSGPHQNGFLSNGGAHFVIKHNSAFCATTGCTSDVAFTDDDVTYDALIDKNLFVASPGSSYCLGVGSVASKGYAEYEMTVTNNVWQYGTNNKCATYGPTYGWDAASSTPGTTGYKNVWSGNIWADGKVLNHP